VVTDAELEPAGRVRKAAGVRLRFFHAVLIVACIVAGAAACYDPDDYQTEKLGEDGGLYRPPF
jgi:hypothetical protein